MIKTEIGSKSSNVAEPIEKAVDDFIAEFEDDLDNPDKADKSYIAAMKYIAEAARNGEARLFYYVAHDTGMGDGVFMGAEIDDERAVMLLLLHDWKCQIDAHSEIVYA